MTIQDGYIKGYEMGYKLCTPKMQQFLHEVWHTQGKTKNNCTGMASFSFYPERLTFAASDDCVVPAHYFTEFYL